MSSPIVDKLQDHRSARADSTGSPHARRSHRSRSRSKERKDRHRDHRKDPDDKDKKSERSHRDRRSRSREKSHRDRDRDRGDKDRDRDRERDRGEKDRDRDRDRERRRDRDRDRENGHRDRDEKDDRKDRRRKRPDDLDDSPEARDKEERSKRKKDELDDSHVSSNGVSGDGRRSMDQDRPRDAERRMSRPPADADDTRRRDGLPRNGLRDSREIPRRDDYRDRRDYDRRDSLPRQDRDYRGREPDVPPPPPPPPQAAPPPLASRIESPPVRRPSPIYGIASSQIPEPEPEEDSEARSVFVSQLAARLTARDLGYFFEDKLGDGAVRDARIVTDRLSRRSKGIGYVELRTMDLLSKALDLSGTIVMGLPIMVQLTESERNRVHAGEGSLNLPPGVTAPRHAGMQLYVGSLHFNLTESDIKQVFEPFGELEFVDLHRDPATGRSKGYCFVQYKKPDDAKMAMEQMDGFELAGRTLRVNTVHDKGTVVARTTMDSLDDSGGGNLNAASRQALMQKLARTDAPAPTQSVKRPNIPQVASSRSVVLKNMFDPEEETEKDWDKELAEDVKTECEDKYGPVEALKVEKESQGEIYVKFDSVESAKKAIEGLNGRWFGGKEVTAGFISDAIMQAHR